MIRKLDEAFTLVCELRTSTAKGDIIGTGMFISSSAGNNRYKAWILTASHVAVTTNENTAIVISTHEGKAAKLPLKLFGNIGWRYHPVADISVFPILFNSLIEPFMIGRCFPYECFNLEKKPVSRDYELTSIGFPHGLGIDGMFSPFTFRSFASSGFVDLLRADTKTLCTFFCLENPSVGGYSGCPVIDLGYTDNGVMVSSRGRTVCHGIMHGTMSDETGGKIAMVTPAFYLRDLIE